MQQLFIAVVVFVVAGVSVGLVIVVVSMVLIVDDAKSRIERIQHLEH